MLENALHFKFWLGTMINGCCYITGLQLTKDTLLVLTNSFNLVCKFKHVQFTIISLQTPFLMKYIATKVSESICFCSCQGVLLYGPPGTGKTLLARAVAHHTECTFIRVSGSELVQKFIGEGSRMVRELFVMARYGASC